MKKKIQKTMIRCTDECAADGSSPCTAGHGFEAAFSPSPGFTAVVSVELSLGGGETLAGGGVSPSIRFVVAGHDAVTMQTCVAVAAGDSVTMQTRVAVAERDLVTMRTRVAVAACDSVTMQTRVAVAARDSAAMQARAVTEAGDSAAMQARAVTEARDSMVMYLYVAAAVMYLAKLPVCIAAALRNASLVSKGIDCLRCKPVRFLRNIYKKTAKGISRPIRGPPYF
ncbi:MAG: hypothetical protein GY765_16720 [bacterium]|nr:hypothetical protein [bacterium]